MALFGGDQGIKVASKWLKSTGQEHVAAIWPLTLKSQVIKSLRREWSSDQAHLFQSNNFIAVANGSTGNIQVTVPYVNGDGSEGSESDDGTKGGVNGEGTEGSVNGGGIDGSDQSIADWICSLRKATNMG